MNIVFRIDIEPLYKTYMIVATTEISNGGDVEMLPIGIVTRLRFFDEDQSESEEDLIFVHRDVFGSKVGERIKFSGFLFRIAFHICEATTTSRSKLYSVLNYEKLLKF